jgi:hypothetical protein
VRVTLRPTVAGDLPDLIALPLPHRIRAITAEVDGDVIGIGGIGYRPDGTVIAFVQMSDEARKYPVAIHRAGLMAMKMIRATRVPLVVAESQDGNPAAVPWLLRLGFRPIEINGAKAFVWERRHEVD